MSVLHDFECLAHGVFENRTGICPHGCGAAMVTKKFLKPAGYHSARTKGIDGTLQQLALDFNLTDMNNQNGTSAVVRPDSRKERERADLQNQLMGKLGDTSGAWGQIPNGQTGVTQAMGSLKATADDALAPLKPMLSQPKPQVVARYDAKIQP